MKIVFTAYFCNYDPRENPKEVSCKTNIKGPKKIWAPKVKILVVV